MKRRWKVDDNFWTVLAGLYVIAWLPIFIAIWAFTAPCDKSGCGLNYGGNDAPALIFLAVYFGVFLVPAAVGILYFGGRFAWRSRPRRVTVPVSTDLRKANHD